MKISVIGLGYVGLPLAVEFGKKYDTIGFDVNQVRINELASGEDRTNEVTSEDLKSATQLSYSSTVDDLKDCNIHVITVPTPVDDHNTPDLSFLLKASAAVAKILKKNDIVVYESTVFPGCTEDECVPEIEKVSGLKFNQDFFVGYSPERMSPGDKERTLTKIVKVVSGSTDETAHTLNELYSSIVPAGTHLASSIKVAEAAKVIENTQRDINIAFINELAIIFDKIGIDTSEVLRAAATKWNFFRFTPGIVGGHCIGVDPYYLTYKAQSFGYHPEMILAGRRINDNMSRFIAGSVIKLMIKNENKIQNSRVLVLGITFKENCPDIRNTKVVDVVSELEEFGCCVDVCDPWADPEEVKHEYSLNLLPQSDVNYSNYDAIILAVAHKEYRSLNLKKLTNDKAVIYDIKAVLPEDTYDARL